MNIRITLWALVIAFNAPNLTASTNPAVVNMAGNQEVLVKKPKPEACSQKLFSTRSWDGKNTADLNIKGTVDFFYGDHIGFFSDSPLDQRFSIKSNWDANLNINLNNVVKNKITVRTKANWGNETSIMSTTSSTFKIGDAVTGAHSHFVPRLVPWVREAWIDFSVNEALSMDKDVEHRVKLGAFPFNLGRGISLGSAYSASNGFLGFCSTNIIDQFAFGTLLTGDIIKNQLTYNAYVGILENLSDSALRVNDPVYANQIGRRNNPERGFGVINFVVAFNTKWRPFNSQRDCKVDFEIEPYIMYNHAPEQQVEVRGDATGKLGTCGFAMDYTGARFEWGVENAYNFGGQRVHALDRNQVQVFVDSDGVVKNRYTSILVGNPNTGAKAIQTAGLKALLAGAGSGQGVSLNGQEVGVVNETTCCTTGPVTYYNDYNRFRSAYTNKFKGMMLVTDAAYSIREDKSLKFVMTAAWATGDENPNHNLTDPNDSSQDGDYQGFVTLQEVYAGKRLESLFVIGNNAVSRPFSQPTFVKPQNAAIGILKPSMVGFTPSIVGDFTNLVYIGAGFDLSTSVMGKKWRVRPSVLSYWQDKATKKFDRVKKLSSNEYADKHLGVEINTTMRVDLVESVTGYFIGGLFVPGKHYDDIQGMPLNEAQAAVLNRLNSTGYPNTGIPILGTSTAIALNWGLDISF